MNAGLYGLPDGRGGNTLATADMFSPGFYAKDRIVISPVSFQFYVKRASGTTTADPSADTAVNWSPIGATGIKSIQRGVIALSGTSQTATISSVDVNKTALRWLGFDTNAGGYPTTTSGSDVARINLTNSTTITASRGTSVGSTLNVSWEIEERW
jgi:hypothetical protein